ncbi:TetR family transcriptional regulator [Mycobacterium sp. DBP42]|uniref:TetR family transcriptional regulator n=1 Tax=Mycobacterium sp. DBP42 TaxID=2545267 RepID=UPI00110CD378|nr:TetR family transcriptional regulator [Mycobacterium sp. DBP42]TMS51146.1 TetR family transcriptional regulator [Mycobacterium sp. DBP42]
MTERRNYGGLTGTERAAERRRRFIAAGLQLMGTNGVAATTLRGVAAQAGVAARYFSESFACIDDLHVAVFDEIVAEIEARGMAAIAVAPDKPKAQARAALGAVTDLLLDDRRKGQIVLIESGTSPVLGPRRLAEGHRLATVVGATASNAARAELVDLQLTAQFALNGVAGALTCVFTGEIEVDREDLVERLTDLLFTTINGARSPHKPVSVRQ